MILQVVFRVIFPKSMVAFILILAAGLAAWATWIVWKRRLALGGFILFWVMVSIQVWTIAAAAEAAMQTLELKIFWSKIQYLGIVSVGPLMLVFTLLYTHRHRLVTSRNALALSVVPVLTLMLVWTNEYHHLFWVDFKPHSYFGNLLYDYEHGPVFWAHLAYAYSCILLSAALLILEYQHSTNTYRRQYGSFILATLFPLLGNMVDIFNLNPLPGLDISALSFAATSLFIAYGSQAFKLLDIVPIARHTLVEHLEDGVVVIDMRNRIVDVNRAVLNMFNFERPPLGEDIFMTFHQHPLLAATLLQKPSAPMEVTLAGKTERHLDVRLTEVFGEYGQTEGHIAVIRDITDRKKVEAALEEKRQQMEHMAITDDLTGLYNRRYVDQLIEREFRRSERYGVGLSIALFDIDNFKVINDGFGHPCGDEALRTVGKAITTNVRTTDIASRVGGDEFMIIFPHTTANDAWLIMERLRKYLSEVEYVCGHLSLSISGGVVEWKRGVSPVEIVRSVDRLLYEAKRLGKNRVIKMEEYV